MIILFSVICGLLSMLAYGFNNAYSKPLSRKYGTVQIIVLRGLLITFILGLACIPDYDKLQQWEAVIATIGLGIFGYLPLLAFTQGIKHSALGIMAPVSGTSPLITLLLSVAFLHVILNPTQWVAVTLVVIANIVVSVNMRNWRESHFFHASSGVPLALAAAVGWGLFYFLLVPAAKTLGPWLAAWLVEVGVTIAASIHLKLGAKKLILSDALHSGVIFSTLLICIGTVAFTIGVRHFNIGIVAVLANSTALVTTFIGVYLFHEQLHIKERVSAAMMILGIAALSIF